MLYLRCTEYFNYSFLYAALFICSICYYFIIYFPRQRCDEFEPCSTLLYSLLILFCIMRLCFKLVLDVR